MSEPLLPDALYAGGIWMLERDRPFDAAHFFRAMLIDSPTNERAWLGLGTCHERLDQDEEARDIYLAAYVAASRKVRCGIALSRVYRRGGQAETAASTLESLDDFAEAEEMEELLHIERKCHE